MDATAFYDLMEQCCDLKIQHVTISGGEPLLHPQIIPFLRKCRECDMSVNILSNLTLLNNEIIDEMKLREQNVMFIDDNPSNRAEVKAFCKDMSVNDIDVIKRLCQYYSNRSPKDLEHNRLQQYKILEKNESLR